MARTIDVIQQLMLDDIAADPVLSLVCTSTSKVAIHRLFTRIVASCIWTVEVLFDTLKAEINDIIALMKPHTLRWYAKKAKDFQFGFSLPLDSDTYDNTGFTDDDVAAGKIVVYSAVTEGEDGKLRIKVATQGADIQPLTGPQLAPFTEYVGRYKDAGVRVQIDSLPADKLKMGLKIYYDPLILNSDGQRIDGADNQPVQNAVKDYLKNLPFNGIFVLAFMTDALRKVEGVVIPHIASCQTAFGALPFTSVDVKYLPDAGYLRFQVDGDLTIEFIPQSQLL